MPIFFASNAIYPLSLMPDWLKAIAHANPLTYEVDALRALNPELRRTTTPMGSYALSVPPGTKEVVETALAAADPAQFTTFVRYTVKSGETLKTIARRFNLLSRAAVMTVAPRRGRADHGTMAPRGQRR